MSPDICTLILEFLCPWVNVVHKKILWLWCNSFYYWTVAFRFSRRYNLWYSCASIVKNNIMLSLAIHVGCGFVVDFAMIANFIVCMNHQRKQFIVYILHISYKKNIEWIVYMKEYVNLKVTKLLLGASVR